MQIHSTVPSSKKRVLRCLVSKRREPGKDQPVSPGNILLAAAVCAVPHAVIMITSSGLRSVCRQASASIKGLRACLFFLGARCLTSSPTPSPCQQQCHSSGVARLGRGAIITRALLNSHSASRRHATKAKVGHSFSPLRNLGLPSSQAGGAC